MNSHFYKMLLPGWILSAIAVWFLITDFHFINLMYTIVGLYVIGIFGNTIGFHRYLTHRSFTTTKFWHYILVCLGSLSGQGSPLFWVGLHLAHHRNSDKENDIQSPRRGLFHAFIGWQLFQKDLEKVILFPKHLIKDGLIKIIHRHYYKLFWSIVGLVGLININFALYFLILGGFFATTMLENISNIAMHHSSCGYKTFETGDDSRNVPWIAWISLGAGWHNNHHNNPNSYKFGIGSEIDIGAKLIEYIKTSK